MSETPFDISKHGSPSPALRGALKRALHNSAAEAMAIACYGEAVAWGALDEGATARPLGASFNPRPARICQLVLDHLEAPSLAEAAGALLSCAGADQLRLHKSALSDAQVIALETQRILSAPKIDNAPRSAFVTAFCIAIDELRHLQIKPPDHPDQQRWAAVGRKLLVHYQALVPDRLAAMLAKAIAHTDGIA